MCSLTWLIFALPLRCGRPMRKPSINRLPGSGADFMGLTNRKDTLKDVRWFHPISPQFIPPEPTCNCSTVLRRLLSPSAMLDSCSLCRLDALSAFCSAIPFSRSSRLTVAISPRTSPRRKAAEHRVWTGRMQTLNHNRTIPFLEMSNRERKGRPENDHRRHTLLSHI